MISGSPTQKSELGRWRCCGSGSTGSWSAARDGGPGRFREGALLRQGLWAEPSEGTSHLTRAGTAHLVVGGASERVGSMQINLRRTPIAARAEGPAWGSGTLARAQARFAAARAFASGAAGLRAAAVVTSQTSS